MPILQYNEEILLNIKDLFAICCLTLIYSLTLCNRLHIFLIILINMLFLAKRKTITKLLKAMPLGGTHYFLQTAKYYQIQCMVPDPKNGGVYYSPYLSQ